MSAPYTYTTWLPTLLDRLSDWLESRREAYERDRKAKGFGYVMTAYYMYKQPKEYIEDEAYTGAWDMSGDPFDCGVREALMLIPDENDSLCHDEGCPHHGTPHICVSGVLTEADHEALKAMQATPDPLSEALKNAAPAYVNAADLKWLLDILEGNPGAIPGGPGHHAEAIARRLRAQL